MIKYIAKKFYYLKLIKDLRREQWLAEVDAAHRGQGVIDVQGEFDKAKAIVDEMQEEANTLEGKHERALRDKHTALVKDIAEKHKELLKLEQMISTLKKDIVTKEGTIAYIDNRIAYIKTNFLWA